MMPRKRTYLAVPLGLIASVTLVACSAALPSCGGGSSQGTTHGSTSASSGSGGSGGGMDASMDAAAPGLTCSKLLSCDQACNSSACTDDCYSQATGVAQGLFNALTDCIDETCANDSDPNCQQAAATGACVSKLSACFADMTMGPADPDGGGVVVPDSGPIYNCGQLNTCLSNCSTDAGPDCATECNSHATPQAEALLSALNSCLAIACPSTDGGPCEMPGLACAGCIEQVTLAQPNTCADPYVACNADSSNQPDGSAPTPMTTVDGGTLSTILTGLDQCASTVLANNGWLYFTQVIEGSPVYRLKIDDAQTPFGDGGLAFGDGGATNADGGPLLESVGPPHPTPVSIAVDANNVYVWSVGTFQLNSSVNNKDGTVVQVPLNGGPAITLASNLEVFYDAGYLNAITVDSTHVYWVAGANGNDGAIMRAPIGGGTVTTLFSGQQVPQAVTTDGTNLYWGNWGTFDAQGISNNDGTVWQGSVNGGAPIKLASNQAGPSTIVTDTTNVYWVNLGHLGVNNFPALNTGSVMKAPIGGGALTTIATGQSVPFSLVISGGNLYWSNYGLSAPGVIMSAPAAGGLLTPLVTGLNDPSALAISGSTLYWTNANSSPDKGFVMSLSPF